MNSGLMRAYRFETHGEPDVLRPVELPDPIPGPGEVVVEVRATGVNFADLLMVGGCYPGAAPPFIPGLEVAGVVSKISPGVERFKEGDRVMGLVRGGSYATLAKVHERYLFASPGHFSFEEAGAFCETFFTAWMALVKVGRAVCGETVLVTAAAGGVGTSALQLAREVGLTVIAAAGSDEKLALLEPFAPAHRVNYTREDLRDRVLEITGGQGCYGTRPTSGD